MAAITVFQLFLGFLTVCVTVVVHLLGLSLILKFVGSPERHVRRRGPLVRMAFMGLVICCLFTLHLAEIAIYALVYLVGGALLPFDSALYFSAVTFTTIGYGDLTVDGPWRLYAALEGLTGIILVSWSVAFLVTVMRRLEIWEDS